MKLRDIFNRRVDKLIEDNDEHEKFMKESYKNIFEMQNIMNQQPKTKFKIGEIVVVQVDAFTSVPCGLITEIVKRYDSRVIAAYIVKTLNPDRVAPMVVEEKEIRLANKREQFLYHVHGLCVLDEVEK